MALSIVTKVGDGVTTLFTVNFALGYLKQGDVTCVVGAEGTPRAITFVATNLFQIAGAAPAMGVKVVFTRTVSKTVLNIDYADGDVLSDDNLNESQLQLMQAVHELYDGRFTQYTDVAAALASAQAASATAVSSAAAAVAAVSFTNREKLAGNRTYFIRNDGNDANTGLVNSAGGAFASIQRAFNVAVFTLDFQGFNVDIQVAPGTYTSAAILPCRHHGGGILSLTGGGAGVTVWGYGAANGTTLLVDHNAELTLAGFQIQANGSTGNSIVVTNGGRILASGMYWGAANAMLSVSEGWFTYLGNTSVVGGGAFHHHITNGGWCKWANGIGNMVGTIPFTTFFMGCSEAAKVIYESFSWSGTATTTGGQRAFMHQHATVETSSNLLDFDTFFPGSTPSIFTGGATYNDVTSSNNDKTVATLPTAAANIRGVRFVVVDATASTFNSVVAGGGATVVPVWCDGAAWRIG